MLESQARNFAKERFEHHHHAQIKPHYPNWQSVNASNGEPLAVLGYRSALDGPLFLESYVREPIEQILSNRFGRQIDRAAIVEIGCFAATPSPALLRLWHDAATLLGKDFSVAVATLTTPLRDYFARVGLPLIAIHKATRARVCESDEHWGRYYDENPWVCAGIIADGEAALARYVERLGLSR